MHNVRDREGRHTHWEEVWEARAPDEVSWHQDTPSSSLTLIEHAGVGVEAAIVDVGGGASRLVDSLLDRGYENVTVLDISERALERARERLGARTAGVRFLCADITEATIAPPVALWHDRAVFHFLTEAADRARYREVMYGALAHDGQVIVATFAEDGPDKCSGLPVARYSPEKLGAVLGEELTLVETWDEEHQTPSGASQRFIFCRFARTPA